MSGILSFIAIAILTIGVGLYVSYPLIFAGAALAPPKDRAAENLRLERERLDAELRDLELDHDMGKIDDEDYRSQREGLTADLAAVGARLGDAVPGAQPARPATTATATDVEARIRAARNRLKVRCPKCGASNPRTAAFCNACGAKLTDDDTDTPEAAT